MKRKKQNELKSKKSNLYALFANIPIYIYLLPLPIAQNLLFRPHGFWEHITSYSLSLLLFVLAGGLSAASYLTKRYSPLSDYAYIQRGFPIRTRFFIPYNRLQSVIIQTSPLMNMFSAVKIQLNTPATKAKKGDAVFYLSKENAQQFVSEIYDDIGYISRHYKARNSKIFFMSAIWSNPVSGLLLISPFIRNAGKVVGDKLREELIQSFDLSAYLVYIGLPPTTAIIAYFLLFCYMVSVITDFVRNANFSCTSYQNGLLIKRGTVKKTLFMTNQGKLNSINVSQSLVMLPARLYSVYIHTVGAGKAKGDKSLLIAAEKKETVKHLIVNFFKGLDLSFPYTVRPVHRALKSYVRLPFLLLICDTALAIILQRLNLFGSLSFTFMLFSIPCLLVWSIFRIIAFYKTGISFNGKYVYVRSYRKLTFRATIIPVSKVQLCIVRRNPFQMFKHTCSVRVYIYGEKKRFVEVKHLNDADGEKLVNEINRIIHLNLPLVKLSQTEI